MHETLPAQAAEPTARVLFVLPDLQDPRLLMSLTALADRLAPLGVEIEGYSCFGEPGAPAPGNMAVDRLAHVLSFEDTVRHLASRMSSFDLVVECGKVPDLAPARGALAHPPPLLTLANAPPVEGEAIGSWLAAVKTAVQARQPAPEASLFQSFYLGGIEASTHRRRDGKRLDMIAAIGHDQDAARDYDQLAGFGMRALRSGFRWHLIEQQPGMFDWFSVLPMLDAARRTGTQVIWDLLHYGWPDDVDIFGPDFVARFARFAGELARVVRERTTAVPFYSPINEISFLAWAAGDSAYLNPFARARGFELKVQLVRAAVAAIDAIRAVDPRARFVHCDPTINVITDPSRPRDAGPAEAHRRSQFEAWDMLAGRTWPQLGGHADCLDIVGLNYYFNNQWIFGGSPIDIGHPLYRPLRDLLAETYQRYGRPIFIAETGTEAERRPAWFAYVAAEVRAARARGIPVEGICLYPVINHPGWDNERDCPNGLLGQTVTPEGRPVYEPLAAELARQAAIGF